MDTEININTHLSKEEIYKELLPQINSLVANENDLVANLANITAALKQTFNFLWVGFYIVKQNELVLGPFQGPLACTRIQLGKGVCGTAWQNNQTIIVPNVDEFPGHIACSSLSKSEIVIPVFNSQTNKVQMVLDVDSDKLNFFDSIDALYLQQLAKIAGNLS
jgi:L-methionine (R)-S-oxide reductase